MEKSALISVVIPTYNRKTLLMRAVDSVLKQTYSNLEVWIIDDGSTDGTEKAVEACQDKRVHYARMAKNSGPSAARNEGIRRANGEIIAFLDSDDIWHSNKLEKQVKKINDNCQAVFCKYLVRDDSGRIMPAEEAFDLNATEFGFLDVLISQNKIGAPTLMLTKAAAESIGGFNEKLCTLEDWDYALRLAEKYKVAFIPEIMVDVFPTEGSVNDRRGIVRADALLCMLRRHWEKYADKEVFDNMIRYLYEDMAVMDYAIKKKYRKQLLEIAGTEMLADYAARQTAALWEQLQAANSLILKANEVLTRHNEAIIQTNETIGEHNEAINRIDRTIADIVMICNDRTRRIERLEKDNVAAVAGKKEENERPENMEKRG